MAAGIRISQLDSSLLVDLMYVTHGRIGVVLNGNCEGAQNVIHLCAAHQFFNLKYYWLIFSVGDFLDLFHQADINLDSNIYLAQLHPKQEDYYIIYEYYNSATLKGGMPVTHEIGYFHNSTDYKMPRVNDAKFWRRRNLSGVTFNAPIVLHEPFSGPIETYLEDDRNREINTYNRYHYRLIKFCKHPYNFSVNMSLLTVFGYKRPDGTMDGLVGELQHHRADFGLSPMFVDEDRAAVITYGRHTYSLSSSFVFVKPTSKKAFYVFLRPLSNTVWYCVVVFCAIAVGAIKICCNHMKGRSGIDLSWGNFVVCVVGIFAQQGSSINPKIISARIAVFSTVILTYLVYTFYSGSLVSALLNIPLEAINNVEDLMKANFDIGIEDNRLNRAYFSNTRDNTSLKLYEEAVMGREDEVYLNMSYGLGKIKSGGYAFHVELAKAFRFIRSHLDDASCQVGMVQLHKPAECYANYQKRSPFRDVMDVCLHRLAESGVMRKEFLLWHSVKKACWRNYDITTDIEKLYPAFLCIVLGLGLAVLAFCFELAINIWSTRF